MGPIRFRAELQRKDPRLPVFIRVPGVALAGWSLGEWITVTGTLDGHDFGRRTFKDWGKGSADWFVEFTKPFLDASGLKPGDSVEVDLRPADMTMPPEMTARMASDSEFARAYEALRPNHQRKAIEHYLEAKTPSGRRARLEKISGAIKARLIVSGPAPSRRGPRPPALQSCESPLHVQRRLSAGRQPGG